MADAIILQKFNPMRNLTKQIEFGVQTYCGLKGLFKIVKRLKWVEVHNEFIRVFLGIIKFGYINILFILDLFPKW
jgi:hypothetical protein